MNKVILVLIFINFTLSNSNGQTIKEIYSGGGEKQKILSNGNNGYHAAVTNKDLFIYYDDEWLSFNNAVYNYQGNNYSTHYENNIKAIGLDKWGTVYLTTHDDHLIYYFDGELSGGVPVKIDGLYNSKDGVFGILKFGQFNAPVKILDNVGRFDLLVHTNIYPNLEQLMLNFDGIGVTYNDHFPMVLANNGDRLGFIHDSGHKVKVYEENTSYLPCKIKQIDNALYNHADRKNYNHTANICEDNSLAYFKHIVDTPNERNKDLISSEWNHFPRELFNGTIQKIRFGTYQHNSSKYFTYLFGFTDALANQIFIYNPIEDVFCSINIPGQKRVLDLDVSQHPFVVSTGDKVYEIDLRQYTCERTTSNDPQELVNKNSESIFPNPSQGIVYLSGNLKNIEIYSIAGLKLIPNSISSNLNLTTIDLTNVVSGVYVIKAIRQDGSQFASKLIIN